MRTSIATVSLKGPLEAKLEQIAVAGFDAVELFGPDLLRTPLTAREVRARADALGLAIDLFQPLRDAGDARRAHLMLALAEQLGAPTLLVCSDVSPTALTDDDALAGQLYDLADQATGYGVRLAFEALAWGTYVNTYRHAHRIVELAGHPALGTCLDSFHILATGDDPSGIEAIPGERIFFLQLADARRRHGRSLLQWSRHDRCWPGTGVFDLATFMTHVEATGYAGPVSIEVFNDDPAPSAREALQSIRGERPAHAH